MSVGQQSPLAWHLRHMTRSPRVLWLRAQSQIWPAVAVLATVIAIVRIAMTIPVFNNTVDEPFSVSSAVALYDVHKHVYGVEHPPLSRLVAGLPLYLSGVHLPLHYRTRTIQNELTTCEAGGAILLNSSLGYRQILDRARGAMLIFPALTLLYLYLLGRWLAGPVVAALAVVFFSLDPTLLGHGMWICTDVAAAAGFLAAIYHGSRWIIYRGRGRAVAAGLAVGLAIACKFSCVAVIPALAGVWIARAWPAWVARLKGDPRATQLAFPSVKQVALACGVAFFSLWATYLFDIGRMEDQARFAPDSEWRLVPAWIKRTPMPMPSFGVGVLWLAGHSRSGHPAYLNGELSRHGWWYYFPEAIALKSPMGFLAALLLAAVVFAFVRAARPRRSLPLIIGTALFLLACMTGKIDIGIRHVLPVLALIYLLVCWQLARTRLMTGLICCIGLAALESGAAHPDYLSYFNLVAGGPEGGDRFLADSNLDWGQDIARLADWLHSAEASHRSYSLRLFMYPRQPLAVKLGLDPAALDAPPHGLFAISKNIKCRLFGFDIKNGRRIEAPDYSWLAQYPLVKRIGDSIDVYDLDQQLHASWSWPDHQPRADRRDSRTY